MASLEKYVQKIHKKLNNERLEEHKVRDQATIKAKSWNYATLKKAWIQTLFGRIHAPRKKKSDESAGVSYCLMQSSDYLCDIYLCSIFMHSGFF